MRLNQVNVCYFLGYRVFHLNSRVHLNEYVLPSVWPLGLNQELYCSRVLVTEFLSKAHGVLVKLFSELLVDIWSWSNFYDFLVATLD